MGNSLLSKEQTRALIKENNIQTPQDIKEALKGMFKDVIQEILEAEMDQSLGYERYDHESNKEGNYRNGYSHKTIKSDLGEIEIEVPRDRAAEFEPKIVPKRSRDVSGIESQIISLYAKGMSTRDIHAQMQSIYGIEVSAEMVSKITDKIIPEIKEWQNRTLDPIYTFIFMDAIHYKVRTEGRVVNRAAYVMIGVDLDGNKDVIGIWIGENETSKFWLNLLNQLKNRGVQDVLIFSVDGLTGIKEAIQAVYPKSEIQRCIIHQLRNSFKFVSYKDYKEFARDFKELYKAPSEALALQKLEELDGKWTQRYRNWDSILSQFSILYGERITNFLFTR